MKPWLFEILACPIDKFFPLKLYIFSFENKSEEFQFIIDIYNNRDLDFIKNEGVIDILDEDGEIYLRDNVVIEKTKLSNYLEQIISSLDEFENIIDKSTNKISKNCFKIINSKVKQKLLEFREKHNLYELDTIIPELYFINKIKLDIEIKTGILFCEKCMRWYPIIDTIPQMLPDKYRDEKQEIEFLKTNKNLLNDKFFDKDLNPFSI
ncbi:MAG: Trm112 family protein [Candidatus Hodarchaeota archaeon]